MTSELEEESDYSKRTNKSDQNIASSNQQRGRCLLGIATIVLLSPSIALHDTNKFYAFTYHVNIASKKPAQTENSPCLL
jgi:hypothetical protein